MWLLDGIREHSLSWIDRIPNRNDYWHDARNCFNGRFNRNSNDGLRNGFGQLPVNCQSDCRVPSTEDESIGGNLTDSRILRDAFKVNTVVLIVIEIAQTLEGGGARFAQIVDEEFDVELGRIGGAQTNAAGKIGLNASAQRNDAHFGNVNGFRELHQV